MCGALSSDIKIMSCQAHGEKPPLYTAAPAGLRIIIRTLVIVLRCCNSYPIGRDHSKCRACCSWPALKARKAGYPLINSLSA